MGGTGLEKTERTLCAAALCAMILAWPAQARLRGDVVEFGEVTAERESPPSQVPGVVSLAPKVTIEGVRFISHTDHLAAQLCLRFGVWVHLAPDRGEGLPRDVTALISHPLLTRPDHLSAAQTSFPTPVLDGRAYAGWTFDHDWELQPGAWAIAFLHGGEVLAAKTFTVTAPSPPGSVCPPGPVS